jgi:hypothetical protein
MAGWSLRKRARCSVTICISAILWAPVLGQSSYSAQRREAEIGRAYQKLQDAAVFNLGGVGFVQQITPEERSFHTLLESPEAITLFTRLLAEANPEGQLYALFALRLRDQESFRVEAEKLQMKDDLSERLVNFIPVGKGKVRVARGCIFFQQDRNAVIDEIAAGEWDAAFKSGSRILTY